eukprot:CAMPEP_0204898544 /NCGR_PEP_ID=MMETSP1397-20131031/1351_1 /ASSEMBLY_ACC=CAM_ASM_000891 /TAXON_ID=49980 /ORGANISM="Climacostomum Climacostomum virens, Strain Stock W-24" /LENGTH=487 /DNA_ID=CAMNT_0052066409 /DNA_START=562 /DNA_END=2025 /DNA_ORIENTATION=+
MEKFELCPGMKYDMPEQTKKHLSHEGSAVKRKRLSEIPDKSQELKDIECAIGERTEGLTASEASHRVLRKGLDGEAKVIKDNSCIIQRLNKKLNKQRKMLEKYSEMYTEAMERMSVDKSTIESLQDQLTVLNSKSETIIRMEHERDRLHRKLNELETVRHEKISLEQSLELSRQSENALRMSIDQIKLKHAESRAIENIRINYVKDKMQSKINELKIDVKDLSNELTLKNHEAAELLALKSENASLKNALHGKVIDNERSPVPTPVSSNLNLAEMQDELIRSKELISKLSSDIEEMHRLGIFGLQRTHEIITLNEKYSEAMITLSNLMTDKAKLEETYNVALQNLKARTDRCEMLDMKVMMLNPENIKLNTENEKLKEKIKLLNDTISLQRKSIDELTRRSSNQLEAPSSEETNELRQRVEELEGRVERLNKQNRSLTKELDRVKTRNSLLENVLSSIKSNLDLESEPNSTYLKQCIDLCKMTGETL